MNYYEWWVAQYGDDAHADFGEGTMIHAVDGVEFWLRERPDTTLFIAWNGSKHTNLFVHPGDVGDVCKHRPNALAFAKSYLALHL